VNDLYHETTETGTADADRHGEYHETEADTEDRTVGQDELPTPQESRAATWGDNPEYYDETDLATEYDGDIDAFIAEQDELPTPQESGAATWGDSPEYYDETDLATEYDGDLSALTTDDHDPYDTQQAIADTGDHSPGDQHARTSLGPGNDLQETDPLEAPEADRAVNEDHDNDPDTVSVAVEQPATGTDHATIEPGPQSSTEERERSTGAEAIPGESKDTASAGAGIPAESPGEAADSSEVNREPDAEHSPAGASDRIAALEARLERLEHDRQTEPETKVTGQDLSSGERADVKETEGHLGRWRLPSDARLNLCALIAGGVLSEAADYIADGAAHHAFGIAGVGLSVGVGIVGVVRENRKSKNAHRPED
jgi:hypothetical protein